MGKVVTQSRQLVGMTELENRPHHLRYVEPYAEYAGWARCFSAACDVSHACPCEMDSCTRCLVMVSDCFDPKQLLIVFHLLFVSVVLCRLVAEGIRASWQSVSGQILRGEKNFATYWKGTRDRDIGRFQGAIELVRPK